MRALFLKGEKRKKRIVCGVWMWQAQETSSSSFGHHSLPPIFSLLFPRRHTTRERPGHSAPLQTLTYHLANDDDQHGAAIPAPHSIA